MLSYTGTGVNGIFIVIASKQEWFSSSLETILTPSGYDVRTTFTRADALSLIRREPPDAIIVDDLPEMSGVEFCRELRERRVITPVTPIIVTLASPATRRDRLAAWRAGAWACLGDPLDAEELLAMLNGFMVAKLDADRARTEGLIDEMTGVYNVRGVTRRARELAAQAARNRAALACVLLAPEFSPSGNKDGEQEALMQGIADALKATARSSDAIGRLGPGSFIIIAVDTDAKQAHQLAERLGGAVAATQPLKLFGGCHGVSDFRAAAIDASELMVRASAALDRARSEPDGSWLRDFDETNGKARAARQSKSPSDHVSGSD